MWCQVSTASAMYNRLQTQNVKDSRKGAGLNWKLVEIQFTKQTFSHNTMHSRLCSQIITLLLLYYSSKTEKLQRVVIPYSNTFLPKSKKSHQVLCLLLLVDNERYSNLSFTLQELLQLDPQKPLGRQTTKCSQALSPTLGSHMSH